MAEAFDVHPRQTVLPIGYSRSGCSPHTWCDDQPDRPSRCLYHEKIQSVPPPRHDWKRLQRCLRLLVVGIKFDDPPSKDLFLSENVVHRTWSAGNWSCEGTLERFLVLAKIKRTRCETRRASLQVSDLSSKTSCDDFSKVGISVSDLISSTHPNKSPKDPNLGYPPSYPGSACD